MASYINVRRRYNGISTFTMESSRVSEFYANCNILLTGGTGFLGKLLIQKLLRTCPDIGDIYLIIRKKKGKSPEKRLEDIFSYVVFDDMKKAVPNYREKVHVVLGDIQYSDMGLHQDDRRMLIEKINVIVHCGASLNFTESLKTAAHTNVRSTRDLLKLADEMQNLKCMMYVSTAYSNSNHLTIDECFYKPPILPDTLIKIVDEMDEAVLEKVTPTMIGDLQNSYIYTKAVAEQLIKNKMDNLPVGVFRPSLIYPTYKDPLRCWTDNVYGQVGMFTGSMSGVYHVMHGDLETRYDNIPGDIVINTLIAAIPDVAKQFEAKIQNKSIVYNCVTTVQHALTLQDTIHLAYKYFKLPAANMYYSVAWIIVKHRWLELILRVPCHYAKALVIDAFLLVSGQKPKMTSVYKKIHKLSDAIQYYSKREFNIKNENVLRLWNEQNDVDKQRYPFNMADLDWEDYLKYFALGIKKYLLKDKMDDESIQKAIDNHRRLDLLHRFLQALLLLGCLYLSWIIFNSI